MTIITNTPDYIRKKNGAYINFAKLLLIAFIIGIVLGGQFPGLNNINRLLGMILVGIYLLFERPSRSKTPPEVLLYTLYVLWCLLSGLAVANFSPQFFDLLQTMVQISFLILAVAGFTYKWRSASIPLIGVVACAVIAVSYMAINNGGFGRSSVLLGLRQTSIFRNPNELGLISLSAFMGLAYLWRASYRWPVKAAIILLAMLFISAIVYSASRKSFICLLLFVVLWAWFCYRHLIFQRISIILFILFLSFGSYKLTEYVWHNTLLGQRLVESFESERLLGDNRTGMYDEGIILFKSHPIAGVGLGNFVVYSSYKVYSHSDYIEVLATTGIIGFLLYFSIYPILWFRVHRIQKWKSPDLVYQMGVIKAMLIVFLVLGTSRVTSQNVYSMYMLAGLFGFTYMLEREGSLLISNSRNRLQ